MLKHDLSSLTDEPVVVNPTRTYESSFSEDIKIDTTNLFEEFADHPAKYAYYGSLYAIMSKKLADVKRELKEQYARVDQEKRQDALTSKSNGGIKFTETMIDNMVITDPRYVAKAKEESSIALHVNLLEIQKEAMKQRKDMLIQLGADNRQSTYDPRVYRDNVKDVTTK